MRTLATIIAVAVVLGGVAVATAQTSNPLVAEGLSLPRDHQYEQYNAASGTYGKVDVSKVPALVKQKQPIYDRTAKAWVYQGAQGLNPKYAAGTAAVTPPSSTPAPSAPVTTPAPATPSPATPAPATPAASAPAPSTPSAATPLVAEGLSLPKDHQYEQYNAASGTYGKVDVSKVPALVKQKQPIYDRTAKAWVYQGAQGLNPKYAAGTSAATAPSSTPAASAPAASAPAASTPAPAAPAVGTPLVAEGLTLPRDHQYERYNTGPGTYARVDVNQVPALVQQKVPIYDRTAKTWVNSPEQKLDPRYAAATSGGTILPGTPLVTEGLSLPRDHQYERYYADSSTYLRVDVSRVPALVREKLPVYDRTAKDWVYTTDQQLNPRYAPGAQPSK